MRARLGGSARFRFHGDLEDHLPPERRGRLLVQSFGLPAGVKDLIEALGVPHPEVDLILANGEAVGFSYPVKDGDHIDVYPDALDAPSTSRLRPRPVPPVRFVLDEHLGRLARYLRLLGFDAWWHPGTDDDELARRSAEDGRVLLTRDRGLLKRGAVQLGAYVRETDPRGQVLEVVRRFDLAGHLDPFTRCLVCNGRLEPAQPAEVAGRVPPAVGRSQARFSTCPDCFRVYWEGSHHERLSALVERVRALGPSQPSPSA